MSDRDKRKSHTPVAGVAAQIASPVVNWEVEKTDMTPTMEPTINESPIQTIARRSGETKNTTLETLAGVEQLRKETREDFKVVNTKIEEIQKSVKVVEIAVAGQGGQNTQIIGMLTEAKTHRDNKETIKTTTTIYEAEVEKTRQIGDAEIEKTRAITEISDASAAKAAKREIVKAIVLKVLAAIGVAWGFISITYLSHCGEEPTKKPVPAEKAPDAPR